MEKPAALPPAALPRLIPTLTAGFNTVAGNIRLIFLPVLLDLLLWFGPHIRVKQMLEPSIQYSMKNLPASIPPDMAASVQMVWNDLLERFNLITALSPFPIGLPSLMTAEGPMKTPLGSPVFLEMGDPLAAAGIWLGLALLGLLIGSFYFNAISRATSEQKVDFSLRAYLMQVGQSLVLTVLLILLALVFSIPLLIMVSLLSALTGGLGQFAMLFFAFIIIWLLIPMVFAPHGIFVLGQKASSSLLFSIRLVRFFLPGTGLFVLTSVILNEGLKILWTSPAETSWMMLIGILGHAFIITSLLAASFIYYRNGIRLVQANIQRPYQPGTAA